MKLSSFSRIALLTLFLSVMFLAPDAAYAGFKVYSPIVDEGELEVEWRGNYDFDHDDAKDGGQQQLYGIGYGVTDRLFVEIYGEVKKPADDGWRYEATKFEAIYQLFEQGEKWLDAGLYFEYELADDRDDADKIEAKLLLEKDVNQWTHTLNLILEKEIGPHREENTEGGLAFSTRYRYSRMFEPGFEYYADFGELSEGEPYREQKHFIGPVIYGKLGHFSYDLGLLKGVSPAAADYTFKWTLEYEF